MEIDIDPIEFKRLYDTLGKHPQFIEVRINVQRQTRRTVGVSR